MLHTQRDSFERPYGVAWLLQLTAELREWDDPRASQWLATLEPLEAALLKKMQSWLGSFAAYLQTGRGLGSK